MSAVELFILRLLYGGATHTQTQRDWTWTKGFARIRFIDSCPKEVWG